MADAAPPTDAATPYQVLARKYRPGHFRDLIGQEAMVQTLTNAFALDRIAHAFILTGVRGVGKTTTARIIAKGLNCTGRGDQPTIDPCGECDACLSIAAGRHVDVIEMDAASNTGVDSIREIIDSVRYRAAQARYKVYIVDEVHMLSTSAFNALLKTLEEPPAHVKFIFATTEIRKVPVTVLSRCQRFDLRRIEPEVMMEHLGAIAAREGAKVAADALALITRAAEGSVRDALSLLDQAVAHGQGGETDAADVRRMLGLADRGRVFDLFEAIMRGDAGAALAELGAQYAEGADPAVVLRDLAELTHWISVLKISETAAEDPTVSPDERRRGRELAAKLSMRVLTRAWQMLLKALEELGVAPSAMMAAEMAVIRLCHVADLPTPGDLVRRLQEAGGPAAAGAPSAGGSGGGGGTRAEGPPLRAIAGGVTAAAAPRSAPAARLAPAGMPLEDIAAMVAGERDIKLLDELERFLSPVALHPGVIEFNPRPGAPADLAGRLAQMLHRVTGRRWSVAVSDQPGGQTLAERRAEAEAGRMRDAARHPLVAAALAAFPGAKIGAVRPLSDLAPGAEPHYLAPVPEDDAVDIEGDILDMDDPFGEES
ncbi:DNA polymerase III subunit gamma/tau [Limibaculum sp. FT325]|uniref:DNA polymerase III subunit gamma/tau n=1 Tax=Thermohalobaculum sediminis TaxID=2939436 RepID=UPI0020BF3FA4|nr:DNA polymerase III subunit gamma/tau [Limibaculum sediminis]MCL5776575.1 DNA polymerase III subunit gamma/tau [Limibaculum sediminis]